MGVQLKFKLKSLASTDICLSVITLGLQKTLELGPMYLIKSLIQTGLHKSSVLRRCFQIGC